MRDIINTVILKKFDMSSNLFNFYFILFSSIDPNEGRIFVQPFIEKGYKLNSMTKK